MANLKTVSELKDSVSGILSGLNLNNVADLNATLERAASNLIQKADVPEASNVQNLNIYSGVYDYAISPTIYGTDLVDIRPQGISRQPWDVVSKIKQSDFDRSKGYLPSGTRSTFHYTNGVPAIRIISNTPVSNVNIDACTAVGNWVASGTASGLAQDTTVYYQSPASLRFQLTSGAGILTETLSNSVNISTYEDVGVAFLAIMIPSGATASNLTSIKLKLGSSSTNYNDVTVTAPTIGSFIAGEWALVPFDFSTASQTGTPNWSAINYVQLTFNTTGSFTNFRIGDLFDALPTPMQILYQTAAVFIPSGSTTPTQSITTNTDTIVFNTPAYNIYLYECALAVLENTGGGMGDPMYDRLLQKLNGNGGQIKGLYQQYQGNNPSEQIRTTGAYYDTASNNGWAGYGYNGIGGN